METKRILSSVKERERIYHAALFLKNSGDGYLAGSVEWSKLSKIPDFVFYSEDLKKKFVFLSASIFYLPCIKRCIQGDKINYIKDIVGDDIFNKIFYESILDMSYELSMDHLSVDDGSFHYAFFNVGSFLISCCLRDEFPALAEILFPYDEDFFNKKIDVEDACKVVESSVRFIYS